MLTAEEVLRLKTNSEATLDALFNMYGFIRKKGETDEKLRSRVRMCLLNDPIKTIPIKYDIEGNISKQQFTRDGHYYENKKSKMWWSARFSDDSLKWTISWGKIGRPQMGKSEGKHNDFEIYNFIRLYKDKGYEKVKEKRYMKTAKARSIKKLDFMELLKNM